MKTTCHFIAPLLVLITMVACTEFETTDASQSTVDNGLIKELSITGKDFIFDGETRSSVTIGDNGASFTWDEDDVIGIFPDKGDQVSFAMDEGAGTQTATFSGGGWALKSSSTYAAYYPHVYENRDMSKIPVSYVGQTQNGNANTDHIGTYDFMAAGVSTPKNGAVAFDMQHLGALVQLTITVPEPSTLSKISLYSASEFTETGTIDLTEKSPSIAVRTQSSTLEVALNNVSTSEANENITVYFMTAPVDLTGTEITVIVHCFDETILKGKITGKNLQAGKAYRHYADKLSGETDEPEESIPNNQIWYTATAKVDPYWNDVFGANIVSNTWDPTSGNGIITFDNDVTKIGKEAFYDCDNLTSVTIPDKVVTIEEKAFAQCSGLTYMHWGKSVVTIEGYAFWGSGLISVTIPDNVTSIGEWAFESCWDLVNITIGEKVTSIGDDAFGGCFTSVTIPDSVTSIGVGAFGSSYLEEFKGKFASEDGRCLIIDGTLTSFAPAGLTEYVIPSSVTSIGSSAFYYIDNLISVTIPNSVTTICNSAFSQCNGLTSITIPDSVISIGDAAFHACENLNNIILGGGLETIGYLAFGGCNLTDIIIPDSVITIGMSAFSRCSKLKNIKIGNSVTTIGIHAFQDCNGLIDVTIPDSVTFIDGYAFENCSRLNSVTIGKGIEYISYGVFLNCSELETVYCNAEIPPVIGNDQTFKGCSSNLMIYVPAGSLEAYQEADYWKDLNLVEEGNSIQAVDLGLSVKWANCNLGANGPEEYGNYYAWGEINTKTDYTPDNSMSWNIPYASCPLNSEGNLILAWDAAYKTWGNSWRMPTKVELDELKNNCKWEWSTLNGVKGYTVTSKINGNSIFLPSNDSSVIDNKETGFGSYWSSTPCSDTTFDSEGRYAGAIGFYAKEYNISENVRIQSDYFLRWCKRGIRPVYNE